MITVHVLTATADQLPHAQALVFEYMATTEGEKGQPIPAVIDQLPAVLAAECANLAAAYRDPGALLIAYHHDQPIGCVGLKPCPPEGTIEVKRLYVRPAHRGGGIARLLMHHAHQHAAAQGFTRVVLDVMPTRTHVIEFYRRLGYTETQPYTTSSYPMIYMQRPITDSQQPNIHES
jgi:ribosomal protein S18 acetylase RimI-like enzyme